MMEPIKSIIKKPPTEAEAEMPELKLSTKKRKSVSFAPSPEKPSKRRALVKYIPAPRSRLQTKKTNNLNRPLQYPHDTPHRSRDPQEQAVKTLKVKPESVKMLDIPDRPLRILEPPPQAIEPFDPENDWFTSMHVCLSCTANPIHVIGIKQNKGKRQCEGIEGLDERLLSGHVNILFHPDREHEPVCETCWTIGLMREPVLPSYKRAEPEELDLPCSWPKEPDLETRHTHIYEIGYAGCQQEVPSSNPKRHSLRLVKGAESHGGNGTMCRCTYREEKASGSNGKQAPVVIRTEISMPEFAGCPMCEGIDLQAVVGTKQAVGKNSGVKKRPVECQQALMN
ncbi:hypothetical protein TWF730_002734 [Orbilia blumenaviensis]|uniref:Uncharacterized protein n=1 Tax=Orbilia blumenaviensis TaxID=1796055 RepID=A0AAV9U7S4_9PEZI